MSTFGKITINYLCLKSSFMPLSYVFDSINVKTIETCQKVQILCLLRILSAEI